MIAFLPHFFLLSLAFASPLLPQPDHGGFSVELIHRDSPKSPFYNPSKTPSQRLADAVARSYNRVNHFKRALTSPTSPQAPIRADGGSYITKFSLGTPPTEILAIVDTGSDLIWTQCEPCPNCYKQKTPLFNPNASSTYKQIRCNTTECKSIFYSSCDESKDICKYSIRYGDGSYSKGDLVTDTLTFGSTSGESISFDNTIWGCGHDDGGFFEEDQSGIFGLGATPASLIRQKGSELGGQKFSYCLAPSQQVTSTLNFGEAGVVSGLGVVSTPLTINGPFYQITLKAISVGDERFQLKKELSAKANSLFDSGTTLTFLPKKLYYPVKSAVEQAVHLQPAPPVEGLSCYYNYTVFEAPTITLYFDGAELKLNTLNIFLQVSENTTCFAFQHVEDEDDELILIGNTAQRNFLVGYDVEGKTLSFKSTDCSK